MCSCTQNTEAEEKALDEYYGKRYAERKEREAKEAEAKKKEQEAWEKDLAWLI